MLICGLAIYHTALKYTLSMVKWNVIIQTVLQSDIFSLTVVADDLQIMPEFNVFLPLWPTSYCFTEAILTTIHTLPCTGHTAT